MFSDDLPQPFAERLCFVLAPKAPERPIGQPDEDLTFAKFIESLTQHVKKNHDL